MFKAFSYLSLLLLFFVSQAVVAYEERDLLQKEITKEKLRSVLSVDKTWVPYPDYSDRAAWEQLTAEFQQELVKNGEAYLSYDWRVVKATDYLAFERTGSRDIMQAPFGANANAISNLVLAELAEGKGRFIDQIINGVFFHCEMTSWVLSAHLSAYQASSRALPDYREHIIDLTAGDIGSLMSWIYYFFHEEFDQVDPVISQMLKSNIQERILDPYMDRSDFWWQALNLKPGSMVNNWNPWCNFNVLSAFLLMEDDLDKLSEGVYKTMVSTDEFINYNHEDGACEEGPSYWGHAAGKLYDYLSILNYATNGQVSIFDQPIIKNMGEYIARSYVGDGWVVNFADASARGGGNSPLIYRYGEAVESPMMKHYAAYLNGKNNRYTIMEGRDMFRSLENLRSHQPLTEISPLLPQESYSWYPQTEFCYISNDSGFFLAAKGGYNSESHNHNDVGTFSLYYNNKPFIIDVGVGTYTKATFSKDRYTIWTMQSDYHNVPKINGISQMYGSQYRSKDIKFNPKQRKLSLDISNAYPAEAGVQKWERTYQLNKNKGLMVEDEFVLDEAKANNVVNFMTWTTPNVQKPGVVILTIDGDQLQLKYNPDLFAVEVETIPQEDRRLSNVWGEQVYRLSFTAKKQATSGKYQFQISKL